MSTPTSFIAAAGVLPRRAHWKLFLAVLGPGLVVMLADTDVGSIITAAQSGAQWGYQLLGLQLLLVPILYIVQELTVRLGIFTGKGHGELIRETFGQGWAWLSVGGLAIASLGAIITEFSGVAGVGMLFGVPRLWSLALPRASCWRWSGPARIGASNAWRSCSGCSSWCSCGSRSAPRCTARHCWMG